MPGPTADQIKDVNVRYHDLAADGYDDKWGISFGARGATQVLAKMEKALGAPPPASFGRSLEIGAGTGYFTLNLARAGMVSDPAATDISQGMLDALSASAEGLGVEVETARCESASLPFEDDSFDLVFGHAVLHHLPDLDASFREFRRVLRPGGRLVFCGEPSHYGDRLASVPKRTAHAVAPLWRALMRARPRQENGNGAAPANTNGHDDEHRLEPFVDVHAFTPTDLERHAAAAGFERVRVAGEELVAGWFGWANRSLEATADPDEVPFLWRQYAYHGYIALQRVDRALERRLPAAVFYDLLLSARAPD